MQPSSLVPRQTLLKVMAATIARGPLPRERPASRCLPPQEPRALLVSDALKSDESQLKVHSSPFTPPSLLQSSMHDVIPRALHTLDEVTLRELAYASVFVRGDAEMKICSQCDQLDVAHIPECDSNQSGRCLFCCGCYSMARQRATLEGRRLPSPPALSMTSTIIPPPPTPADPHRATHDRGFASESPGGGGDYDYAYEPADAFGVEGDAGGAEVADYVAAAHTGGTVTATSPIQNAIAAQSMCDARGVIADMYADLLADRHVLYDFGVGVCPSRFHTFAVPAPSVTVGNVLLGSDEIPLPNWIVDVPDAPIAIDGDDLVVTVDKTLVSFRWFLLQLMAWSLIFLFAVVIVMSLTM